MNNMTAAAVAERARAPQTALQVLPDDGLQGTLVGRVWAPQGAVAGPAVVALRPEGVFDLSAHYPTMSTLLDTLAPAEAVRAATGQYLCSVEDLLANSLPGTRDTSRPWLLAPCDLQVVKAAGVTFAASLIERVIEEQARGDASRAQALRSQVIELIGENLADIRPGSPELEGARSALDALELAVGLTRSAAGSEAEAAWRTTVSKAVDKAAAASACRGWARATASEARSTLAWNCTMGWPLATMW